MQDAKVVSSPRWQTSADSVSSRQSDVTGDTPEVKKASVESLEEARARATDDTETDKPAIDRLAEDAETATLEADTKDEGDSAEVDAATTPRAAEPASASLKPAMLAILAICSVVAAVWSYMTMEVTRTQLDEMTRAKATVEQALKDSQAKLAAAEKAVAGVKAALSGTVATSPAEADPMR